jgi:hypothetical protein
MVYPKKLITELLYDPAIPLLLIHSKELKEVSQRDICLPIFIAVSFTTEQGRKQV